MQISRSCSLDAYAILSNRSCLQITGSDSFKLLQGLTSNQINKIEKGGDGLLSLFMQANVI
jgi:folate-binding Fe-S cluster repair protein YgfZ